MPRSRSNYYFHAVVWGWRLLVREIIDPPQPKFTYLRSIHIDDNDVFFSVIMCEQLYWPQNNPSVTTCLQRQKNFIAVAKCELALNTALDSISEGCCVNLSIQDDHMCMLPFNERIHILLLFQI